MIRLLFCIVALSLASATGVFAAPLEITPSSTVRSAPAPDRLQRYARYAPAVAPGPQQRAAVRTVSPHVYLMRGLMNVFSLGLDDLADRLRADGVAATVTNHADADAIVNQIVAGYQAGDHSPIVLIGHSLGADAVIDMAQSLDRYAIPVSLLVLFDGTAPHAVPGNVTTAINFTKAYMISPRGDFHGTLSNVDLRGDAGIDHLTIEKSPALQATTIDYVLHAGSAQAGTATRRQ